jgi:F0F1-type ATP synthase assembly protein I
MSVWRHLYAGTALALTILVGTFVGLWADRHWGIRPWGAVIGAFVGIGAGLYNFFKEFSSDAKDSK